MTKSMKSLVALGFTSALAVTSSIGQEIISFDENGHSGGTFGPLPFTTTIIDPVSGLATLSYALPFPVAPGDVLINETQGSATSDILRFQGQRVWVFSELEVGENNPDLADVPILPQPSPALPVAGPFSEVGPEGNNGIVYVPVAGGPGAPSFPIQYQFTSDAVPEPGSLALIGLGSLGALMWRRGQRA